MDCKNNISTEIRRRILSAGRCFYGEVELLMYRHLYMLQRPGGLEVEMFPLIVWAVISVCIQTWRDWDSGSMV
jgi:hypothetical protein